MSTPNLLDAVHVVKENERIASENYSSASQKIHNPMGKKLFEQLSEFEQHHLVQLTALEKKLEDEGNFIHYEGMEFPLPPTFEIRAAEEPDRKSVMAIITGAIELEQQAEKAYADLAAQIGDAQGHKMFLKLAKEEHNHYLILSEAYWSLNNFGVWKWASP